MKPSEFLKKIFLWEIAKGLRLTLSRLFTRPVTKRYPKEKREAAFGFRGLHALSRNPVTGEAKCVGCGLCVAVCPSKCIYLYTSEGPDHKKIVDRYEIEVLRCVYCGFCMEACPYSAVLLTQHYEYSNYSREVLYMNKEKLLLNWDKYMAGEKGIEYFERFWRPKSEDFRAHDDQAVFRGTKTPAETVRT